MEISIYAFTSQLIPECCLFIQKFPCHSFYTLLAQKISEGSTGFYLRRIRYHGHGHRRLVSQALLDDLDAFLGIELDFPESDLSLLVDDIVLGVGGFRIRYTIHLINPNVIDQTRVSHAIDVPQALQIIGVAGQVKDDKIFVLETLVDTRVSRRTLRRTERSPQATEFQINDLSLVIGQAVPLAV